MRKTFIWLNLSGDDKMRNIHFVTGYPKNSHTLAK
jgi:hypothetical protein